MWKRKEEDGLRRYLSCFNKAAARSLSPDSLIQGGWTEEFEAVQFERASDFRVPLVPKAKSRSS